MPKCEICDDTGGYCRDGGSFKRCDCGAEPQEVPEGCHPFTVDADSPAADEMRRRIWRSTAPGPSLDRLPRNILSQITQMLCDCRARFVLCWEENGLHTIHGNDGMAFTGPEGSQPPEYVRANTLERAAYNLRRALFEFGDMKISSIPPTKEEDTLEAALMDERCSREFARVRNHESEIFLHIEKTLELHRDVVRLREAKVGADEASDS